MAGGASSRMKRSLSNSDLPETIVQTARSVHKSLIPVGREGRPLLYYLLRNAVRAAIENVYIITSKNNESFKAFINELSGDEFFNGLHLFIAVQFVPKDREKPMGTADALQQCMEQFPELKQAYFTVCNGDNLYSAESLKQLSSPRDTPHALIAYEGASLGHTEAKLAKFALLDFNEDDGQLISILEKPDVKTLLNYKKQHGKLWVSMNIFNFLGSGIYPFLKKCPIHPVRKEKELPEAVRQMVEHEDQTLVCYKRSEKIPDLTSASDIRLFSLGT